MSAANTKKKDGYLEFSVASQVYGIAIGTVREINQVGEITPVPKAATQVCGVMNLRGQVLPVVDLCVRLNGTISPRTRTSCVIVIQTPSGDAGLLVDSVSRVTNLLPDQISATPEACHLSETSLVAGVAHDGEKTITILKMDDCTKPVDTLKIRSVCELRDNINQAALQLLD